MRLTDNDNISQGYNSCDQIVPNGTRMGYIFRTFWLDETKSNKIDIKSPRFLPIGANML